MNVCIVPLDSSAETDSGTEKGERALRAIMFFDCSRIFAAIAWLFERSA